MSTIFWPPLYVVQLDARASLLVYSNCPNLPNFVHKSPSWVCPGVCPCISETPWPMMMKLCMRNLNVIWKISKRKNSFKSKKKKYFSIFWNLDREFFIVKFQMEILVIKNIAKTTANGNQYLWSWRWRGWRFFLWKRWSWVEIEYKIFWLTLDGWVGEELRPFLLQFYHPTTPTHGR